MFKLKYLPQYILVLLLLILLFLEGWTYYLGTANVTFERLVGSKPYTEIKSLSLRRYKKNEISPHLFTIETDDEKALIDDFTKSCHLKKVTIANLPKEAQKTDKEMVDVIKKSPFIYLSDGYDLISPENGRMCILFRDKTKFYLFINGNL